MVDRSMPLDLLALIALVIASAIFVTVPVLNETIIRPILGIPFVLFVPGYALISALFPRNDDLDGIERIALSIGLSICLVVFVGLALNYTPWGIRLGPILMALSGLTLALVGVGGMRRMKIPASERFTV